MIAGFRWVGFLVGLCIALPPAAAGAEDRAATATTEQVLKGLGDLNAAVRAWCIEYEGVMPDTPFYVHRTLAARFPDCCLYRGAKGSVDLEKWRAGAMGTSWRDDHFQDWVLVSPAGNSWGKPWNRDYGEFPLDSNAPLPFKMAHEVVFFALGWWTFPTRPSPRLQGDVPRSIPGIIQSKRYAIAPRQELHEGVWCHVLEDPGRDRIWINTARPFAIVARAISDPATGATIARAEMDGHRQDKPGIWVPREIHYVQFNDSAPTPEGWQERLADSQIRILEVRLNEDVDDALFRREPMPPGALRHLAGGGYEQAVPGGFDHMDHMAAWLRSRDSGLPPETNWSAVLDYTTMAVAAAILVALSGWRIARRLRGAPARLSAAGVMNRGLDPDIGRRHPDRGGRWDDE